MGPFLIILVIVAAIVAICVICVSGGKKDTPDTPHSSVYGGKTPELSGGSTTYKTSGTPVAAKPEIKTSERVQIYEFIRHDRVKLCPECDGENAMTAESCRICGCKFGA